nr:hypothetical protein [Tanacetum cinerariifolium]
MSSSDSAVTYTSISSKDVPFWGIVRNKKINTCKLLDKVEGLVLLIYKSLDLWDALARNMLGSEYGEQDRKAAVLYESETFKATEGELLLDTYIRYLQVINDLKKCGYNCELNFKVKCYNCKKEGHFAKDCKKVKIKDYEYYKTKMLLAKKDSDEQVLLAEDQAWMESSSDYDQEINANMEQNNEFNEQMKVLNEKNADLLAQTEVLQDQLKVKHVVIDTHTECQAQYAKLKEERYEYMIRYSTLCDNDKQNRKKIDEQKILFDKMSRQLVEMNNNVLRLQEKILEKKTKISELEGCIVQICHCIIDSGCSKHMKGNRALLTNFVKKFLETVRFGNNDFAGLEVAFRKSTCFVQNEDGVDLLTGDHSSNLYTIALNEVASNSSTCLLAKASSSQSWLWHQLLSHLNFATINNLVKNNLVQVVVDDDSWYTWVFFLYSKDEASEVIISFIKKTQVNLQLQVQLVRTDNGTEFKNKTLAKFFDEVGIFQQFSAARTPQQNGYWKAQGKRGYWSFFGYSKESAAFRIYNKRTRKIHKSVNVNFDEISEMASKQFGLEPDLSILNEPGKSLNPSVSQVSESLKKDLEDLFHNFYDKYFDASKIMKSSTTNVESSNVEVLSHEEEVFHENSELFQEESSSSSLNDDVQQSPEEVIPPQTNTQLISNNMITNVDEASTSHNVFNERLEDAYFDANLDTLSSVRRPKSNDVMRMRKGSSNTSNVDLSYVSHSKLNKDVKRYSSKHLLSCNNSHLGETSSAYVYNDAINVSCNSRLCDSFDENNLFIFDDESVRISPVSKMPFRKMPRYSLNVCSKSNSNKSLSKTVHMWLPKMQLLVEPVDKWIPKIKHCPDLSLDHRFGMSKHMTGNRAMLTNFVEEFLGTVRFGNNDFAVIAGYGDVVIRSMTIKKVYYVEGLGHNLFNVGQFCDKGLKVSLKSPFESLHALFETKMLESPRQKGNIGVFVGYSKESAAFRIYNKQTRKIHESVNVNFVKILEMASKQFSLELGLSNLNKTGKSSNLSVSQVSETSKKYLEDLFQKIYDEYFDASKIMKFSTTNVETCNVKIPSHEEVFHKSSESFQDESSSFSLNDDVQQSLEEVILPQTNTQSISNNMVPNVDKASTSNNVFNDRLEDAYFDASTSFYDPSNVHTFYQPYPHEKK